MNELLKVENISKHFGFNKNFFGGDRTKNTISNINFIMKKGEVLSLIGQSGAGKTTLAKIIAGIIEPSSGKIFFNGKDISNISKELFQRKVQMVFQDPYSTLNPMMKVETILKEPILINHIGDKKELNQKINQLISSIGLPKDVIDKYPHELSGGQRQRVAVARALSLEPELLICDEPLSSVDAENRQQIIKIFKKLQENNKTLLLIDHDLNLVKELSDYIAVMLNGEIVESGPVEQVYNNPRHWYTKQLLSVNSS